mgnify:CR=1 FL=1
MHSLILNLLLEENGQVDAQETRIAILSIEDESRMAARRRDPPNGAIKGEPKNPAYSSGHIGDSATAIVRSLDSLDPPQLEIGPFVKGSRDTLWCSEWVQSNGLRACRPVATVCVS